MTVLLKRSSVKGPLTVRVTTDSASPAVGVNVGIVNQTLTFPKGQSGVAVNVPILAGAPNPGEVDVSLNITPLTPRVRSKGPLQLRILANTATPPRIISLQGKPEGIVVSFSKAMDPAGATNLNNYEVTRHVRHEDNGFDPFALLKAWGPTGSTTYKTVDFQSARYDTATNSVTLIPTQRLKYSNAQFSVVSVLPITHPDQSDPGPLLTDLRGNQITMVPGAATGYFAYMLDINFSPQTFYHP